MVDFKLQCLLGLAVIRQLLHKTMNLSLGRNGWLFECVAIEYLEPSGDSFILEYFAYVWTFLCLNPEKKVNIFVCLFVLVFTPWYKIQFD